MDEGIWKMEKFFFFFFKLRWMGGQNDAGCSMELLDLLLYGRGGGGVSG